MVLITKIPEAGTLVDNRNILLRLLSQVKGV